MQYFYKIARKIRNRFINLKIYRLLRRQIAHCVTIRRASENDLQEMNKLYDQDRDSERPFKRVFDAEFWLADYQGQLVGSVEFIHYPPEQFPYTGHWLCCLNVKKQFRRLRAGEKLCQALINQARADGLSAVDLIVKKDNIPAVNLYLKLGFEFHTIPELGDMLEKQYLSSGYQSVIMRKQLLNHA
jgi:ribosomal protein S18 acetylase RimI-like enzyme